MNRKEFKHLTLTYKVGLEAMVLLDVISHSYSERLITNLCQCISVSVCVSVSVCAHAHPSVKKQTDLHLPVFNHNVH